jgi:hypothetical protein
MAPDQKKKEEKGKNCHQAVVGRERKKRPGGTAGQRERQQQPTDRRLLLGRSIVRVDSIKHHLCAHHLPTRTHTHTRVYTEGPHYHGVALFFSSLVPVRAYRNKINGPKRLAGFKKQQKNIWVAGLLPADQAQRRHNYKQQQQQQRKRKEQNKTIAD